MMQEKKKKKVGKIAGCVSAERPLRHHHHHHCNCSSEKLNWKKRESVRRRALTDDRKRGKHMEITARELERIEYSKSR